MYIVWFGDGFLALFNVGVYMCGCVRQVGGAERN